MFVGVQFVRSPGQDYFKILAWEVLSFLIYSCCFSCVECDYCLDMPTRQRNEQ